MFEEQIKYFYNLIRNKKRKNISDLYNGIISLKLSLKIKESIEKKLLVKF